MHKDRIKDRVWYMRSRIHKIAKNGMYGRKKDTLLLVIVIMMSFFFSSLAIVLQGSFQKTKAAQRLALYGSWHAAYLATDAQTLKQLEQEKQITEIGKSYLLNTGSGPGIIGTYNQELLNMGRFNLIEGNFPQKSDEIVLESSKASQLGLTNPIGEKISVVYEFVLEKASQEEINEYTSQVIKKQEEKLKQEGITPEITDGGNDWNQSSPLNMIKSYRHRTIDWENLDNDISLTLSNLYYINYYTGDTPGPEEIRKNGILEESILRVTVPYTVCGVISDYSERWDVSYYSLANAFISEDSYKELNNIVRNTKLTDNSDFSLKDNLNIFLSSDTLGEDLYRELAPEYLTKEEIEQATGYTGYGELSGAVTTNNIKFRKNNFAYPVMEGSTETTMLIVILTIIFIATVVSVFQIFLSQIKRRSRKIALLKSIGATNSQVISMLAWEGAYLLLLCLPTGALSSVGLSYLILQIIRLAKGMSVVFYMDIRMFGFGLLAGIVSVIIGMALPAVYAASTPLVGTMTKPPKHNTQKYKKKLLQAGQVEKRQSFKSVTLRHISLNKGKTLLNLAISAITVSILISSVFICYMSFKDYNNAVAIPNKPDYTMEIPYGVDELYISHYCNSLMKIPGIKSVQAYRRGENLHLYQKNLENDEMINDFYTLIPEDMAEEHFAPDYKDGKGNGTEYGNEYVDDALIVNMYGIDIDSEYGKAVMNSVTDGKLDKEAFASGKEVILILPNYKKDRDTGSLNSYEDSSELKNIRKYSRMKWLLEREGGYRLSLSKRYRDIYEKNDTIKAGDKIIISADEEIQLGDGIISEYNPYEVEVGGIISYFPHNDIWPFFDTSECYAVIGSSQLFESIYKGSSNSAVNSYGSFLQMLSMFKTKFGKTVFHIYGNNKANRIKTDTQLIEFANSLGADLYNYRENNQMLYKGALNNALIIGLLGFATSVIAIFILYNILASTAIQEKHRMGILQSIGVTNKQLAGLQIKTGLIFSVISIVIAHIIVIFVMLLTPFGSATDSSFTVSEYVLDVFRRLELYPWLLHCLICVLFTGVTVLIYYLSSIKLIKQSPVEKIRI